MSELVEKKYVTRFFPRADEKPCEEFYYATAQEAKDHLSLFADDAAEQSDTGYGYADFYRSICVMDEETNTVLELLEFRKDGRVLLRAEEGGFARLRPSRRKREEAKYVYLVRNINEKTRRCLITCLNSKLTLPSSQTVSLDDLYFYPATADVEST